MWSNYVGYGLVIKKTVSNNFCPLATTVYGHEKIKKIGGLHKGLRKVA